ncbi:MAG: VCBS repeat-containing protein, partial [Planctomycetales bacterium]|nr:VCBS repeat-containing protein [Planctomycetales bacterium]
RDQGEFGHSGALLHFYRHDDGKKWFHRELTCPDGEGLKVSDIDADDDVDVVVNSVWLENTGDIEHGAWDQHVYAERWMHPATFVATQDVNGDGRTDILLSPSEVAGRRYRISWFEAPANPREKYWTEHPIALDVESVHHFIGAADFDLDGDMDVVTAEMVQGSDPDEVQLYLNAGDSRNWKLQVIATSGSHSMRVLDVDRDGDPDLFGANWQGHSVDLWINEVEKPAPNPTDQSWHYLEIDNARRTRCFGIATGDIDADGDYDIAAGDVLYRNPGGNMEGKWERVALPKGVDANWMCDVDHDDCVDILAQRIPQIVWLEATDSKATEFELRVITDGLGATFHDSSQGFTAGDVTGDGRQDFVFTSGDGIDYLSIPENPMELPWTPVKVTRNAPEEGVAVGDIDGDGRADIVAWIGSGSGSQELGWWRNPGAGATSSPEWEQQSIGRVIGDEGDRVAVGDINRDGLLDVVATGTTNKASGSAVYWFANPGAQPQAGTAWPRFDIGLDQGAMNSLSVADINGDGTMEVVTGEHRGAKRVSVWSLSPQDNHWTARVVDTGKESHLGTQLADLDGDGDLEIISIAWDDFKFLHVWRNDRR